MNAWFEQRNKWRAEIKRLEALLRDTDDPASVESVALAAPKEAGSQPTAAGAVPTDEQIREASGANENYWFQSKFWITSLARAIEAAHGIAAPKAGRESK